MDTEARLSGISTSAATAFETRAAWGNSAISGCRMHGLAEARTWGLLARLVCLLAGRLLWFSIMGVRPILGFVGRSATDALGVTNT